MVKEFVSLVLLLFMNNVIITNYFIAFLQTVNVANFLLIFI